MIVDEKACPVCKSPREELRKDNQNTVYICSTCHRIQAFGADAAAMLEDFVKENSGSYFIEIDEEVDVQEISTEEAFNLVNRCQTQAPPLGVEFGRRVRRTAKKAMRMVRRDSRVRLLAQIATVIACFFIANYINQPLGGAVALGAALWFLTRKHR